MSGIEYDTRIYVAYVYNDDLTWVSDKILVIYCSSTILVYATSRADDAAVFRVLEVHEVPLGARVSQTPQFTNPKVIVPACVQRTVEATKELTHARCIESLPK